MEQWDDDPEVTAKAKAGYEAHSEFRSRYLPGGDLPWDELHMIERWAWGRAVHAITAVEASRKDGVL